MSIKYKIFLAIFGMFLTTTHVLADCIVTNNNFNKSSKIIFVNQYNGSDQLAKTYSLDNVRNPYEANNVAAFQSVEKAQSHINSDNGDLLLIKAGPQWINYDAWEGNKISDFNKEIMKAKGMSQGQCQGESLTWVPSAVHDDRPVEAPGTTDFVSNEDEVTLASTEENASIRSPNISSTNSTVSDNTQQSGTSKRGGGSGAGNNATLNNNRSNTSRNSIDKIKATETTQVLKNIHEGNITYSQINSAVRDFVDTDSSELVTIIPDSGNDKNSTPVESYTPSVCVNKKVGVNIGGLNYYSSEMPLVDLSKMSTGWMRPWNSEYKDIPLDLDSQGYLKSVDSEGAIALVSDGHWQSASDNRYVILYDGEGQLEFLYIRPKIISQEQGRIEFEIPNVKTRWGLKQTATNTTNYLRNIRIIPSSLESDYKKNIVRDKYKKLWAGVGVFRYLKASNTTNSSQVKWEDRQLPGYFGSKEGISLEDLVEMSNETNTSPWITVPHLATDNYMKKMAEYVSTHLDPHLRVYLEYSNEIWNWKLKQSQFIAEQAKLNGVSHWQEYAKRAEKLFNIWSEVFVQKGRVVNVIGTQYYNPWISNQILSSAVHADALAVGYYLGHELGSVDTLNMSNSQVFNHLENHSLPEGRSLLKRQKAIADDYDVDLIAYEAGQHIAPVGNDANNQALVEKLIEINNDQRMYDFYVKMEEMWNQEGGDLLVWFQTTATPSKWGSWGLLNSMDDPAELSPKYRAVMNTLSKAGC